MSGRSKQGDAIGIVAAAGDLPPLLAECLLAKGIPPVVVALKGIADKPFPASLVVHTIRLGAVGKILQVLQDNNCREFIFSGRLSRPSLADLRPDATALQIAGKALMASDNTAMEILTDLFRRHGLHLGDLPSLVPELFAGAGSMTGDQPNKNQQAAIALGLGLLKKMGDSDIGQAIVVQEKRVLAVEAAEGTDGMLGRVKPLINPSLTPPVLVKIPKSAQNRNLDPPVVGKATIEAAAAAGITCVAVAAGEVIIAGMDATIAAAKQHRLCLLGVKAGVAG